MAQVPAWQEALLLLWERPCSAHGSYSPLKWTLTHAWGMSVACLAELQGATDLGSLVARSVMLP